MKKKLNVQQEFEILKLVLDKFLWMGFGIMAIGFYVLLTNQIDSLLRGVSFMFAGAVILMLLMFLLLKEYEISK
jgi:uncharacterized membrane protein